MSDNTAPAVSPEETYKTESYCSNIPGLEQLDLESFKPENIAAEGSDDGTRAIVAPISTLWDNGSELTYTFVKDAGNNLQQTKVSTIIKEWEKYTNIKFKQVQRPQDATIRISFTVQGQGTGNWSHLPVNIRKLPYNQNTMNLGDVLSFGSVPNTRERRVILHEFGHTLGMSHEHQSPARVGILDWKEKVVIDSARSYWSEEKVRWNILRVLPESDYGNFTRLDLESIMMYPTEAYKNVQGITIGTNTNLSETDKAFMQIHYPHFGGGNPEGISFTRALEIMGVDGQDKDKLLRYYSSGNWKEIRENFRVISIRKRATR